MPAERCSAAAPAPGTPPALGTPGPYRSALAYTDRATKARYIADKYAPILRGRILDVGCDAAPLRTLLSGSEHYVGVDVRSDADAVVNLDRDDLPFAGAAFDTVVCTDVLEHLDRCHAVFDELCRVARSRVIVSLPNPLGTLVQNLHEGGLGKIKYYGLPVDPPVDRHRWFFGFEDAQRFLTERGRRNGFRVEQLDTEGMNSTYWRARGDAGRDVLDSPHIQATTLWCVLARDARATERRAS